MSIHTQAEPCFKEAKRHTRKKLLPLKSLEKKLDRVFSEYIRRRDANEGGTVSCVTCGKLMHWKECHASHFVKRQHRSTRWDERNVHAQCPRENVYMGGSQDLMAGYILDKYGIAVLEELLELRERIVKYTRQDLIDLIEHFNRKIVELER